MSFSLCAWPISSDKGGRDSKRKILFKPLMTIISYHYVHGPLLQDRHRGKSTRAVQYQHRRLHFRYHYCDSCRGARFVPVSCGMVRHSHVPCTRQFSRSGFTSAVTSLGIGYGGCTFDNSTILNLCLNLSFCSVVYTMALLSKYVTR